MNILFYVAIILFFGFLTGKLVSFIKLPSVTGYLIAGLLIGPQILGFVPANTVSQMGIISEVALGIIAFNIGSEFSYKHLKKLGSQVMTLTIAQSLGAFIAVMATMVLLFQQPIPFSLIIASIATATAPAATLLVVRQYNAKGPVVDLLLPVVAIDDAVCVIMFSLSTTIAKAIMGSGAATSVLMTIFTPIWEILLAVLIGIFGGLVISLIKSKIRKDEELLVVILGALFLTVALANTWNVSALIACMTAGAVVTNLTAKSHRVFNTIDRISLPIYIAFFTLSGAELDIGVLKNVGILGIGYIIARSIGKIGGTYLGAKALKMPRVVQKYLGIALLPQAGVAIGLSMVAQSTLPEYGASIRTIVLCATLVYELVGPVLTKMALLKAGEIK